MGIVFRIFRAVLVGIVMYFSVVYLGFDKGTAAALCLIPMVLGALDILTEFGFAIAALAFVVAAFSSALPDKYGNAVEFVSSMVNSKALARQPVRAAIDSVRGSPESSANAEAQAK
ncbi:hypothetical protein [Burkholderia sp. Bp9131]|uniref:hypothetical protein n=1 Tax=Burkholderia sp. Bp9131 TaxID=2184571 RepID=UPI000F57EB0B|nr:hypothetical protein [Burkholderia sp. Bp9131]